MSFTFEDISVKAALKITGLDTDMSSVGDPPYWFTTFIAWSSLESLLLRPEYAWLSRSDVKYIRLPQPLDKLSELLERSLINSTPTPCTEALIFPIEQWRWGIEKLQTAILNGNNTEALGRLSGLRRFAIEHWPGWYERPLADLHNKYNQGLVRPEDVQALTLRANSIAALDACKALLNWSKDEAKWGRIASFEDVACYISQGVLGAEELSRLIAEDPWWKDLGEDLSITRKMLVDMSGDQSNSILNEQLLVIEDCLPRVKQLLHLHSAPAPGNIDDLRIVVKTLLGALSNLAKFKEQTLKSLCAVSS